ncbi:beta-ketoacyl-[acyl-carrier-protein] synthase family protein [Tistrella mobilis]|uniref:3-oxoacyl-[acyl-carrier-protein] synthase II (Beta-ketoacyl-ACP synthase II) (KAS II) n=1 Tax=Tistrella mobilis (strain KA081020-065) TaxID=1110502 RepID=I3THU1_TISMK|nr:beta-ketoacyl-[acyl-carrier-protein] synthase family protein [Tistrella mobilis]AFK52329.1 3-oxoacyl-[acyl-carrier-protein] synthase II (Beta-ketoacyl-ACP synthase II) (KAS II) [Tistrella mobilis KA081020-065]
MKPMRWPWRRMAAGDDPLPSGQPAGAAADRPAVAVTGIGCVTAFGVGRNVLDDALAEGRVAAAPITRFDPARFTCRIAAEVPEPSLRFARDHLSHELERMSLFVRLAVHASMTALGADPAATGRPRLPEGRGLIAMGVAMGGLPHIEQGVLKQERAGPRKTTPFLIPSLIPNMAASMTALRLGFEGPQVTLAGACASGTQAIGHALAELRAGRIDWALAGGSEAVTTPITWSGFEAMHALSRGSGDERPAARPFDGARDGMICGEAAAMLLLHRADACDGRAVLGRILGYATNSGAPDLTRIPDREGLACMRLALEDAGVDPTDLGAVMAQASGMITGDAIEAAAIAELTGSHRPPVTSVKGATGYLFAANGPVSTVAALGALSRRRLPPVAGFRAASEDTACIDVVAGAPRDIDPGRPVLVNSFGFGGINASLVVAGSDGIGR